MSHTAQFQAHYISVLVLNQSSWTTEVPSISFLFLFPQRKQQCNILSSASAQNCDYAVLKTQAIICILKYILNAVTQFTGPKSLLSGIQRCPVKYFNLSFDDVLTLHTEVNYS